MRIERKAALTVLKAFANEKVLIVNVKRPVLYCLVERDGRSDAEIDETVRMLKVLAIFIEGSLFPYTSDVKIRYKVADNIGDYSNEYVKALNDLIGVFA